MKKNLLIDGDYFGNRSIFTLVKNNPEITLETERDQDLFYNQLLTDFIKLHSVFKNYVDDMIFVFDSFSWRKSIEPIIPYYLQNEIDDIDKSSLIYKANRSKTKEESPIDWHNFKVVLNRFSNDICQFIKTYKINEFEGDDLLYFVSKNYSEDNQFNIIFCTDGDLKQLLNDNTILFRNITHSKQNPNGEFCISRGLSNVLAKNYSLDDRLLGNVDTKQEYLKSLLNLNGVLRALSVIDNPMYIVMSKILSGDAKDNILPLFRWKSSTGTRNYSLTEKHINNVFDKLGITANFEIFNILNNPELPKRLIAELASECKQYDILKSNQKYIDSMYEQYLYNRKLNWLNMNIYETYKPDMIRSFETTYNQIESAEYYNNTSLEDRIKQINSDLVTKISVSTNKVKENFLNSIEL